MDVERFEHVYRDHAPGLFSFLAYRTGDPLLAEDLMADVFERALRARRRFDPRKGGETTWLYAIAINRLRDHSRHVASEQRAADRLDHEDGVSEGGEEQVALRDELSRALATLTAEERETVSLRFGADLTTRQIARVTGERVTTVDGRLYRGLRKLRTELGQREAEADPTAEP